MHVKALIEPLSTITFASQVLMRGGILKDIQELWVMKQ